MLPAWAHAASVDLGGCLQAWAVLEQQEGDLQLARQMYQCAVRADPCSQASWEVCLSCGMPSCSVMSAVPAIYICCRLQHT